MQSEKTTNRSQAEAPSQLPPSSETRMVPVIQQSEGGILAKWRQSLPDVVTNLPSEGRENQRLLINALSGADKKTRNVANSVLTLKGVVVHPAEVTQRETGEIEERIRCVMVCTNGDLVSTMSDGVIRVLRTLLILNGHGEWNPPIKLTIREHPGEGGKSYCDAIIVKDEGTKKK